MNRQRAWCPLLVVGTIRKCWRVEVDIDLPATEIEVADLAALLKAACVPQEYQMTVRRLAFERDRLRDGLREIATHSVCCDARHCADRVLTGKPAKVSE